MRNKNNRLGCICVMLIVFILQVNAQVSPAIQRHTTWEEASLSAASQNKLVLVDVMDSRIPPGHKPVENKIMNKRMKDFFNKNVVSVQIDVATQEGLIFVPKLLMYDYPVYAFFMPYGDLLTVVYPSDVDKDPLQLIVAAEEALKRAEVKKNNSRSVRFEELPVQEILNKAKKENKLIFIYAYKQQCQPCILMEKELFNLDKVADFYNKKFICLKICSGQEGEWTGKYKIQNYPTYLYVNEEEKEVYRAEGNVTPEEFIRLGETALIKAQGIVFRAGDTESLLAEARLSDKLIFMDCRPVQTETAKLISRVVYADPEVAEFFNARFVNVRKDTSFKALCFMDATGKMIHRVTEVQRPEELLQEAHRAVEDKGIIAMMARYRKGDRSPSFVEECLLLLDRAELKNDAAVVALEYLSGYDLGCLKGKKYWELFDKYVTDVNSGLFGYVYDHRPEFYILFGEQSVNLKIKTVWIAGADGFISENKNGYQFDEAGFKEYIKRMKKEKVEGWRGIERNTRLNVAEKMEDWKTFVTLAEEKWNEERISDAELYEWGVKINKLCRDKAIRYKTARWLAMAANDIDRKEQQSGKINLSSYKGFFEKLVNDLLQE